MHYIIRCLTKLSIIDSDIDSINMHIRTYQIPMKIIVVNNIMPPNTEPMTIPAISPPVSPSDSCPVSVTVGTIVVDDMVDDMEGVIDDDVVMTITVSN